MAGWVYILSTATHQLLKVGFTDGHPKTRAKQLSDTSSPDPYIAEFALKVENARSLESLTHSNLSKYRHTTNREFFNCELSVAVDAVRSAASNHSVLDEFYGNVVPPSSDWRKKQERELLEKKRKVEADKVQREKERKTEEKKHLEVIRNKLEMKEAEYQIYHLNKVGKTRYQAGDVGFSWAGAFAMVWTFPIGLFFLYSWLKEMGDSRVYKIQVFRCATCDHRIKRATLDHQLTHLGSRCYLCSPPKSEYERRPFVDWLLVPDQYSKPSPSLVSTKPVRKSNPPPSNVSTAKGGNGTSSFGTESAAEKTNEWLVLSGICLAIIVFVLFVQKSDKSNKSKVSAVGYPSVAQKLSENSEKTNYANGVGISTREVESPVKINAQFNGIQRNVETVSVQHEIGSLESQPAISSVSSQLKTIESVNESSKNGIESKMELPWRVNEADEVFPIGEVEGGSEVQWVEKIVTSEAGIHSEILGEWFGSYVCSDDESTDVTFLVSYNDSDAGLRLIFSFQPEGTEQEGSFILNGDVGLDGVFSFDPVQWISQLPGYALVSLSGQYFMEENKLVGNIEYPRCKGFEVYRKNSH